MNLFAKRKTENQYPSIEILPYSELFEKAGQQFLSQREIKRKREREQVAPRVCNCRLTAAELGRAEMRFFSSLPRYIYIYIQIRSIVCAKRRKKNR